MTATYRFSYSALIASALIFFSVSLLTSCEEEMNDSEETEENLDPTAFDLVFLSDNATDVVILPYLTWTASSDPEGGAITYQVLLDPTAELVLNGETEPSTVIGENINRNGWTMTQGLTHGVGYSWMVIAYDANGGSTKSSSVFSFTTAENGVGNNPPGNFNLITPFNGETNVSRTPVLAWQPSIDPDGDPVSYDVYLDDDNYSPGQVSSMQSTTSYTVSFFSQLDYETWYGYEVIAYDNKGFWTECQSVFAFETLAENQNPSSSDMSLVTMNSPLQSDGRWGHQALVHNDQLYVVGGKVFDDVESGNFNDVWSYNGTDWTQIRATDAFDLDAPNPSDDSQVLSYGGLLYVFNGERNTIQTSSDGVTWEQVAWTGMVSEGTHYPPVQGHQVVELNGAIYLIGGSSGGLVNNDVWKSTDGGIEWSEISDGSWEARRDHQVVVYDGDMYLIGGVGAGVEYNDIWVSSDGANWVFLEDAPWTPRSSHHCTVFNNYLWVIGGDAIGDTEEIWRYDFVLGGWEEYDVHPDFSAREGHQTVVWNDELYILFGKEGALPLNDIWKIE